MPALPPVFPRPLDDIQQRLPTNQSIDVGSNGLKSSLACSAHPARDVRSHDDIIQLMKRVARRGTSRFIGRIAIPHINRGAQNFPLAQSIVERLFLNNWP